MVNFFQYAECGVAEKEMRYSIYTVGEIHVTTAIAWGKFVIYLCDMASQSHFSISILWFVLRAMRNVGKTLTIPFNQYQ